MAENGQRIAAVSKLRFARTSAQHDALPSIFKNQFVKCTSAAKKMQLTGNSYSNVSK
jgi:hypothetical protein